MTWSLNPPIFLKVQQDFFNKLQTPFTNLRTSLCESEDVVDKEQHILTLLITEVLCYSQSSQSHSGTGTRGLVHLSVHQGDLAPTKVTVKLCIISNMQKSFQVAQKLTLEVVSFRLMTPDSIISWYKSFPSRVRSPTPANTE